MTAKTQLERVALYILIAVYFMLCAVVPKLVRIRYQQTGRPGHSISGLVLSQPLLRAREP